ncbi:hypothetical protein PIB30_039137 [Stylosanthes scabra]|uniref:NAC domain-containing protein n=1 Tax=Stylosanthes scabra TaxID=79078 RepID=A0ABU6TEE8_9FABA|nr:hypothetical protein [Stylosanthes scabra]
MNNKMKSKLRSSDLIDAKHCPACGHKKQQAEWEWVGLPAGVKFDPTDQELIEHLDAKVDANKSHPLIDEFIPTIEGEDGICYTHPEKLPGVSRDGLSRHFFHRPSKAYTTGTRKRRKIIQSHEAEAEQRGDTRWHKTGKTRPVMLKGIQKGCKKILVLYTNFGKNRKPEKTNWVMHQYHLGLHEEETDGELVVSKIFYQTQPRHCNWSSSAAAHPVNNNNKNEMCPVVGFPPPPPPPPLEHLSMIPFRKTIPNNEVGIMSTCQQHTTLGSAAFHENTPTILDDLSTRFMTTTATTHFNQQQQQHDKKVIGGGSSTSGLEELIMGCTSASTTHHHIIKEASMMTNTNPQEAEWFKYSSYWPQLHW